MSIYFIAISQNYVNNSQWGGAYNCPSGISATSSFHHLLVLHLAYSISNWMFVFLVDFSMKAGVKLLPTSVRGKLAHPQLLLKNPLYSCQSLRQQKKKPERLADKNHYFLMYKLCVMKSLNYIVLEAIYAQRTPQLEAISLAGRLFPGWFW